MGRPMNRMFRTDAALDRLNDERDHVAIQVNLAWDADPPDLVRLAALQRKLDGLRLKIHNYQPADA